MNLNDKNFETGKKTYIGSASLQWKDTVMRVFKGISPSLDFRL